MIRTVMLHSRSVIKLERMTNSFIKYLESTNQELVGTSLINSIDGIFYNQITYLTEITRDV